ncbi:acylglycerol kinase, mitochondrial isoform X1 [Cimex lectularius]|uniref:DAGKc domain-containing protein n=1 Tax=Cimex lectularius TaxID=79782 RepID=A0A8I6RUB0_CIMLE|nr:acylglycerol kinase, mitochondrial isoform X1 [Cimex lectularius]
MGKIANLVKVVRNNWKKSLFATGVVFYGVDYAVDQYRVSCLMRAYCESALKYGDAPVGKEHKVRRITVILNPAANKKRAKKQFESYCAPLLYLSGVYVSILETEKEGHARNLVDKIDPRTDALVIAGGDGTLSEAVTGLMRSNGELCKIPIGVLPLGQRNSLASILFERDDSNKVEKMAQATMAIIKGNTKPIDVFRIEPLDKAEESNPKPVYGVGTLEWGLRRELRRQAENFWYLGPLGQFATLVFHGSSVHTTSNRGLIQARLRFSPPCAGCNKCYKYRPDLVVIKPEPVPNASKWWNFSSLKNRRLMTQIAVEPAVDYTKINNEHCSVMEEKVVKTSDLYLTTSISNEISNIPKITLKIGPVVDHQGQLLSDGLKLLQENDSVVVDELEAKQVEITPLLEKVNYRSKEKEDCIAIDNEDYEVRPIKVTILPNSVKVFCN